MTSPRMEDTASRAGLRTWLSSLQNRASVPPTDDRPDVFPAIFGSPLHQALKHSSVAIRLVTEEGEPYVWGYIPAPVAKIGLFLKQNGGSEKRMRELQDVFDTPPNYGKVIDWTPYTVHDAAGLLRRYLNMMPEPVIPKGYFKKFCRVLLNKEADTASRVAKFHQLVASCPQANQYLLLYILDLLALFSHKSSINKMTCQNLAIVFQPSILTYSNLSSKDDHALAVQVIEFLITHQDQFLFASVAPPPKDVAPEDLTDRIAPGMGDYIMVPSDSDEEVEEYLVHVGGGSLLARSSPTSSLAPFLPKRGRRRSYRPPHEQGEHWQQSPVSESHLPVPDSGLAPHGRGSPRKAKSPVPKLGAESSSKRLSVSKDEERTSSSGDDAGILSALSYLRPRRARSPDHGKLDPSPTLSSDPRNRPLPPIVKDPPKRTAQEDFPTVATQTEAAVTARHSMFGKPLPTFFLPAKSEALEASLGELRSPSYMGDPSLASLGAVLSPAALSTRSSDSYWTTKPSNFASHSSSSPSDKSQHATDHAASTETRHASSLDGRTASEQVEAANQQPDLQALNSKTNEPESAMKVCSSAAKDTESSRAILMLTIGGQ